WETEYLYFVNVHRCYGRVWERDGFGFAVARIVSGDKELDSHAGFCLTQVLATLEQWKVSPALQFIMNPLQPLARDENIHILREPAISVGEKRHCTCDGVRYAQFI